MASTSDLSMGILMPLVKNRFRVSFLDSKKEPLSFSDDLTRQVTSVSGYVQSTDAEETEPEFMYVKVEEDLYGLATMAMQKLLALDEFTLRLEFLDGNETVMKTVDITNAFTHEVLHSDLDYASCTRHYQDRSFLKLKIPEIMGQAINVVREKSPEAEMIFQLLANAEFSLDHQDQGRYTSEDTVSPVMVIGYNATNVKVSVNPRLKLV